MMNLKSNIVSFFKSFRYAFNGILYTIVNERNMRFHLVFSLYVVFFSFICGIEKYEWLMILLMISVVLTAEIFNTAIEKLCDMISDVHNEKIMIIKDCSAGVVLIMSVISVVIGLAVFLNDEYLNIAYALFKNKPTNILLLIISLCISFAIVFVPGKSKVSTKNKVNKSKERS